MNGFPVPAAQYTNGQQPPPAIFGGYDGSPISMNDMASQMFVDSSALLEESSEAKRRRIARV